MRCAAKTQGEMAMANERRANLFPKENNVREIHIYRADSQPMTRFDIGSIAGDRPRFLKYNKRHQIMCHQCRKMRYAKNLRVQVYYDKIHVFCADGCE